MQANQVPVLIAGVASGLAVAAAAVAVGLGWENATLRARLGETQQLWRHSSEELAGLRSQQAATDSEAAAQRARLQDLQSEVEILRQQALAGVGGDPSDRPTRARIYSDGRYVGLGWVQPEGASATDGAMNVVLDPGTVAGNTAAPPAASSAYTAFSVAHQYPAWPYLWTTGWIDYGLPTNNPSPPIAGQPPSPPANPTPGVAPVAPSVPSPAATAMTRWTPTRRAIPTASTFPRTFPQAAPGPATPGVGTARRTVPLASVPRVAPTAAAGRSMPGTSSPLPLRR